MEKDEATAAFINKLFSLKSDTECYNELTEFIINNKSFNINHLFNDGSSLLHLAVSKGNMDAIRVLLENGHPWNIVDNSFKSVGDVAKQHHFIEIYDYLVQEGTRVELLLSALGITNKGQESDERPSNSDYLNSKLVFSNGALVDEELNGVMMGWEEPLMKLHADVICPTPGKHVLNVGFGLGIIDTEIQKRCPETHTIIEAHPDVYKKMLADGWDKKPGVKILFGRWQDVLDQLTVYDAIFFDTFGEYYDDLKEFHESLVNILAEDGIYSYFNGLCGTNAFFHEVSCKIAECDLLEMGIETEYNDVNVDELGDEVWKGIKRAYWDLPNYRVPKCFFQRIQE